MMQDATLFCLQRGRLKSSLSSPPHQDWSLFFSVSSQVLDSVVLFAGEQRRRSSPPQLAGSGSSNEDSTLSLVISTDQGGGPEDNYWSVRGRVISII